MSGPTRPQGGGTTRQPWVPDQAPRGVTCPACGLANDPGARVCRNCGLPIASADDPLRGITPGRVDILSVQRSGLSATVGLALVVGLLIVGGTLAVSGGGILDSGGRIGVSAEEPSPTPGIEGGPSRPDSSTVVVPPGETDVVEPDVEGSATTTRGTAFDYTCEEASIADLSKSRWFLSQFKVGERLTDEGNYDRITWEMTRQGSSKSGTEVTIEWLTPKEARSEYGATLVKGERAVVVTFDGPVDITANQQIDSLLLEPENVLQIRTVDMFEGEDGNVRTVIGLRGDSCVRMSSTGWKAKGKTKAGKVYVDVEKS
jgi:hypothetical protein